MSSSESTRTPTAKQDHLQKVIITLSVLFGLLWLGGLASYMLLPFPPPEASWAGPLFLWLAAALAVLCSTAPTRRWLIACGLLGFAVELLGLHTGLPFGEYCYLPALGPGVLGSPLAIGAAWLTLMGFCGSLSALHSPNGSPVFALRTALAMVLFDLMLDPLAAGPLDYWRWPDGGPWFGVPLLNFAGWFVTAFLLSSLRRLPAFHSHRNEPSTAAQLLLLRTEQRSLLRLGLATTLFFCAIAVAKGFWLPAGCGLALAVWAMLRERKLALSFSSTTMPGM